MRQYFEFSAVERHFIFFRPTLADDHLIDSQPGHGYKQ